MKKSNFTPAKDVWYSLPAGRFIRSKETWESLDGEHLGKGVWGTSKADLLIPNEPRDKWDLTALLNASIAVLIPTASCTAGFSIAEGLNAASTGQKQFLRSELFPDG